MVSPRGLGFPGRDGWPKGDAKHIHAVYCKIPMKRALRDQIRSYVHGGNGLRSDRSYRFLPTTPDQQATIRDSFNATHEDPIR